MNICGHYSCCNLFIHQITLRLIVRVIYIYIYIYSVSNSSFSWLD